MVDTEPDYNGRIKGYEEYYVDNTGKLDVSQTYNQDGVGVKPQLMNTLPPMPIGTTTEVVVNSTTEKQG